MTVRVAKPSHECAAGRKPYTIVVLLNPFKTLKYDSCCMQMLHCLANIQNRPPQSCIWSGLDALDLLNPQHRMADLKHQGVRLVRYKIQTEHALIKIS